MPGRRFVPTMVVVALVVVSTPVAVRAAAIDSHGSFVDDDQSRFEPYIEAARAAGLTNGCNPPANDHFCPERAATRADVAMMLARSLGIRWSGDVDYYHDDDGSMSEPAVNGLAESGVLAECHEAEFCPDQPVTRGEMAHLVAGALGWTLPANTYPYRDLDGAGHGLEVKALGTRGALEPCDSPVNLELCPDRVVTREELAFVLAMALDIPPTPVTVVGDTSQPLEFSDAFDSLSLWDGRMPGSRNRVSITDDGYIGSGLQVSIPKGSHFGSDFELDLGKKLGEEPDRLFYRYYLRLDENWAPHVNGKLPGFAGVYNYTGKGGYESTPGAPGWSARTEFFRTDESDPRARLGYYVYHLGQDGRYGDGMQWNEAGKLLPGEWYCLEGEVALNTPGLSDGALRAWVDGTPAFDLAGIQFRRPGEPQIKIESFWMDVYYGGKPVALQDTGLTIDEVVVDSQRVGCGAGEGTQTRVKADVDADGFDETVVWGACPGGTCFSATSADGSVRRMGDGAWFSIETQQRGIAAGDFNGDGRDDLIYRGRCDGSVACWRVHPSQGRTFGPAQDWGDGPAFVSAKEQVVTGDWNGDGFEDIAYRGVCADGSKPCWQVGVNRHGRFSFVDWGPAQSGELSSPASADIDGDLGDDLIYAAPCDSSRLCWFSLSADDDRFSDPVNLGLAQPAELERNWLFDYDGDGDADLLSVEGDQTASSIVFRRSGPDGLADPVVVSKSGGEISDMWYRSRGPARPVEAVIARTCDGAVCTGTELELGGALYPEKEYRALVYYPRRIGPGLIPI